MIHTLLRPQVLMIAAGALSLGVIVVVLVLTGRTPSQTYTVATTKAIAEHVRSSGTVQAADTIDLGFETSGRIVSTGPSVGTHLYQGQTLATLGGGDASAQYAQVQAALAVQEAKLDALKAGNRPESVAIAQSGVSAAQTSLIQARSNLIETARDAYQKSDDAIRNKSDVVFNNPRSSFPTFVVTITDSQIQQTAQSDRVKLESDLTLFQTYLTTLSVDSSNDQGVEVAAKTSALLIDVSNYLDEVSTALTKSVSNATYPTPTIQGFQSSIGLARASVSAESITLNTAITAKKSADSALQNAQAQLTLQQAPATAADIAAQEAQVQVARANLTFAGVQLGKTAIRAPISGLITRNDAHLGQTVSPGTTLISVISDKKFQMQVFLSETDRVKVHVSDMAEVGLDAYQDGATFKAHVIAVDPAATVTQGVGAYKVTLEFSDTDPRIAAGQTGTAVITGVSKASALIVPSSAIVLKGTDRFVMKQVGAGAVLTPVTIGIESDGETEVLSGLVAGDSVRSFGTQQ